MILDIIIITMLAYLINKVRLLKPPPPVIRYKTNNIRSIK